MGKFLKKVVPVVAVGATAAYITLNKNAENYFNELFKRNDDFGEKSLDAHLPTEALKKQFNEEIDGHVNWFKQSTKEHLRIKSYDGLMLDSMLVLNHTENHRYLILVHGFKSDRYTLLKQAYEFDRRGFNILMIDQRAYGDSEGEFTTFGLKEHLDLTQWIQKIIELDEEAMIGLYGVSTGASTVMMALGTQLDKRVKFAIEEAGYTRLEDIVLTRIQKEAQLSPFIMRLLDGQMMKKLGFCFVDVEPINSLKENNIPICFVHSVNDRLVPYEMANELYHANLGPKAFYPIQSMPHGYACYKETYFDDLMAFINKYL